MIETTVDSIRVSLVTQHRVVILKEVDGDRHLPIWIGAYEAEAIAMELQGVTPTRPLPYDLVRAMLTEFGASIERIVISDLNDQVFYARIMVDHNGRRIEIDSRPSDAIAIAVRTGTPIMVDDAVMQNAGIALDDDESDSAAFSPQSGAAQSSGDRAIPAESTERSAAEDDRLSVFRDFINSLDLDDFDRKRSS